MSSNSSPPATKSPPSEKPGKPDDTTTATTIPNKPSPQQQKYKCPQCPSSFKRPENLKRHERGHDDGRRFMCSICGKRFARSDILGRHAAVHVRRNDSDKTHRKRACRECARARERCSRGEPCRRCAAKALCCVYPEEDRFKITMPPQAWQSSTFPGRQAELNTASSEGPVPQRSVRTPRDAFLQGQRPSQCEVGDYPASDRRPSVLSHRGLHSTRHSRPDNGFASLFNYESLSTRKEGPALSGLRNTSTNDVGFSIVRDAKSRKLPGVDLQTPNITTSEPGLGSNQPGLPNSNPYYESEDQQFFRQGLDSRHLSPPLHALFTSAQHRQPPHFPGSPDKMPTQGDPNVDFGQESFGLPQSRLVNLKAYELIATTFKEDRTRVPTFPYGLGASSSQNQHDLFIRLYFEYFRCRVDDGFDDAGLEELGGFAGLDAAYEGLVA